MADITIHGLNEEVMERLRLDAEATGQSLEEMAILIMSNWYAHIERIHQFGEELGRMRKMRPPKPSPRLEELRKKYGRPERIDPATEEPEERATARPRD